MDSDVQRMGTTKGGSRQETPEIPTTQGSSKDHEYKVQPTLLPPCIDSVDDMNEKVLFISQEERETKSRSPRCHHLMATEPR